MKDKILQYLKTQLPGVQKSYLEGVAEAYSKTITTEADIETVINEGVINALKLSSLQIEAEGNRRANDAAETAILNYEKKHNLKDGKPVTTPVPTPTSKPGEDKPSWLDEILEINKKLTEKVEALEKENNASKTQQTIQSVLGASKILPDVLKMSWSNRIDPSKDVAEQVKALETEYQELHTSIIGSQTGKGLQIGSPVSGEVSEDEAKSMITKM